MAWKPRGDLSEYDRFTMLLSRMGAAFGVAETTPEERKADALPSAARTAVSLETTSFYFDKKGRYVGRQYMDRDECDRFTLRSE